MSHPDTLVWLAGHELRLGWRDWVTMITVGHRRRMSTVAIMLIVFFGFMHLLAYSMVRRYALTGERFDAQEARRIGLVHEVVPLVELEACGERIVHELLTNGPDAIAQTKLWALRSGWSHLDEKAFGELVDAHAAKRQSEEAAEGFAAFREKRKPRWAPETKR